MRNLLAFEWRYHTRQLAYFAALALVCSTAFVLISTGFGPTNLRINSPYIVTYSFGMMSLVGIFVVTVLSANGLLRDTEHRMSEIIFATPIGRWSYLLSRFIGVVLVSFAAFLLAGFVLMLAPLLPGVDAARLGPVQPWSYAWALLIVVLPNLVIATAIVFAIAAATRSTLATWVGGVLVYALYFITAMLVDSPLMAGSAPPTADALARAAILDPFGLSAFFEQTRYWTPAERNAQLVSLSGNFLWNRLLWLTVAGGIFAITAHRFRMRVAARAHGRPRTTHDARPLVDRRLPTGPSSAFASAARLDIRYALTSRPSVALMLLWVFFISVELWSDTSAEYGSRMYPTTATMLGTIAVPLARLGALVLIFFAAELVWRARANAMDELLNVTPAPPAVFYLAHLAALAVLVIAMTAVAIAAAIVVQLLQGYHELMLPVYASLFWTATLPLLILSVLVLLLNVLSPNRYVGMFLSLMVVAGLQFGVGGLEHPLARYGAAPEVTWSDLSGFSSSAASFAWFTLYWGVVAGFVATLAVAAWRRGRDASLWRRLAAIPRRLGRRGIAVAGTLLAIAASLGGFLYYQGNVRQRYITREAMDEWRAGYERAWRSRIGAAPEMTAITSEVALYPGERRYAASGSYRLENRTNTTIDTVWISVRREARDVTLALDGIGAVVVDTTWRMYGFARRAPLAPGDTATFTFSLSVQQPRLRAAGFDESLAANGTFLINTRIFPQLGFNRGYEIDDTYDRRRLGLPVPTPSDRTTPAWITFETTVSTAGDQVAIAPGTLQREWMEGGRRFFHYRSDGSMVNWFAFASARYAERKKTHNGVAIEVYYHAAHAANVDRMIAAAATSLDLFGEAFGPYPYPELRIVEVPSTWSMGAAVAFPGTIFFVEDRGFLTDARDSTRLDIVTRRVAHEVAHQWWGSQLSPAAGPGATMLVESFAKYGEQRVLAERHGEAMVEELMTYDQDRYLSGRTGAEESEVPLTQVTDESWLYYGKGGVVMSALRTLVGQETLDRSLQRLLREHGGPEGRATTADFLAILHAEAPEEYHAQVDEWLEAVVLYDLSVPAATATSLPDGRFEVTIEVKAMKLKGADAQPLGELVDVAVYGADGLLATLQPFLTARDSTLTITVDGRPERVVVDPFLRRLDRERSDNGRKVILTLSAAKGEDRPNP